MEGIPDIEGFRQCAKVRSERNWEALEKSGAFAGSLRLLQLELLDAYWHCTSLSPCIAMPKAAFDSFMATGEFHPFGATLSSSGTVDLDSRQEGLRLRRLQVRGGPPAREVDTRRRALVHSCIAFIYISAKFQYKENLMGEDLMDLITQLQERYQIDQADIDTLVEAVNTTVNEQIDAALEGGMEPGEEGLPPEAEEEGF
jgi:hypothetical protein